VFTVEMAEAAQAQQIVGVVPAAVRAIRHVVEGHVLSIAHGAAALVSIAPMNRLPLAMVAQQLAEALKESAHQEGNEAPRQARTRVGGLELAKKERDLLGHS